VTIIDSKTDEEWNDVLLGSLRILEASSTVRGLVDHIKRCEPIFDNATLPQKAELALFKDRAMVRLREAAAAA
jgi:hypothetical protein